MELIDNLWLYCGMITKTLDYAIHLLKAIHVDAKPLDNITKNDVYRVLRRNSS